MMAIAKKLMLGVSSVAYTAGQKSTIIVIIPAIRGNI